MAKKTKEKKTKAVKPTSGLSKKSALNVTFSSKEFLSALQRLHAPIESVCKPDVTNIAVTVSGNVEDPDTYQAEIEISAPDHYGITRISVEKLVSVGCFTTNIAAASLRFSGPSVTLVHSPKDMEVRFESPSKTGKTKMSGVFTTSFDIERIQRWKPAFSKLKSFLTIEAEVLKDTLNKADFGAEVLIDEPDVFVDISVKKGKKGNDGMIEVSVHDYHRIAVVQEPCTAKGETRKKIALTQLKNFLNKSIIPCNGSKSLGTIKIGTLSNASTEAEAFHKDTGGGDDESGFWIMHDSALFVWPLQEKDDIGLVDKFHDSDQYSPKMALFSIVINPSELRGRIAEVVSIRTGRVSKTANKTRAGEFREKMTFAVEKGKKSKTATIMLRASADTGETKVTIADIPFKGKPCEIIINGAFLYEALSFRGDNDTVMMTVWDSLVRITRTKTDIRYFSTL